MSIRNRRELAAIRLRTAAMHFRNGSPEHALAAIDDAPDGEWSAAANSLRSDILARLGRNDEALAAARAAHEAKPDRADIVLRLAERLLAMERSRKAVRVLERACARSSSDEAFLSGLLALPLDPRELERLYTIAIEVRRRGATSPGVTDPEMETRLRATLRRHVAGWEGRTHRDDALIVARNQIGSRPKLFWCFQSGSEFAQLADALGPEQPVYGMRSGHLIIDYSANAIRTVAALYAREIMELAPSGPLVLAGNCQGGFIARVTAMYLREAGFPIALLILMEQSAFRPYDGAVSLIFGRDSSLNPYRTMDAPDAFFAELFGNYSIDIIEGAHGQFFAGDNLTSLATTLTHRLAAGASCEASLSD